MSDSDSDSDSDGPFKKKKTSKPKATDLLHRVVFSIIHSGSKDGHLKEKDKDKEKEVNGGPHGTFACLARRVRTAATFRVYEAWEKKMGKMYWVKRNIFVAPYEYIEVTLCDRKRTWMGKVLYDEHNVDRVRATRDDTWELDEFLDNVQRAIQFPKTKENVTFSVSEAKEERSLHTRLHLEIKERIESMVTSYMKPLELTETADGILGKDRFLALAYACNLEVLHRLVRTGKYTMAQAHVDEGFTDVHAFAGEQQTGWCALQWAAHAGQRKAVLWLLDTMHVDPLKKSKDGWTAMHCACQKGHFEVAKLLYERGCSLQDSTTGAGDGQTPLTLMMEHKHVGMLRYFIGEQSKFAQDAYKAHGVRSKEMPPDMYLVLKPLPPEVLKAVIKARKKKLKEIAERRDEMAAATAQFARAAAGIPEPVEKTFSRKGSSSSSVSAGTKTTPTPSGTAKGNNRDVSPASSTTSVRSAVSGRSPSPPKRK